MDGKAVKVKQHVTITDGTKQHIHIASSNSPTPELINDIAAEMTAPEPQQILKPINTLALLNDTTEIFTANLTASSFFVNESTGWTDISISIPDGTYTFNTAELRHNSTPYFRLSLSRAYTFTAPLRINWSFIVLIGFKQGFGIFRNATIVEDDPSFSTAAGKILAQDRGTRNLRIETIAAEQISPPLVLLEAPAEGKQEEKKIVLPPTRFTRSGMMERITIKNTASPYTITLNLITAYKITTADVLYLEITIA